MALSFNKSQGKAQKTSVPTYKFENGENRVRIVGDILPRYVYWVTGENNKNIPVECLAFNRDEERFDNAEKDWVKEYYPDLNCSWAYATQCIVENEDGNPEIIVINLKKKLWEAVIETAEELGDPTDPDAGWELVFNRKKTGPHNFNVEYSLQPLKCKPRPLTDAEKEVLKEIKSMDDVMPRPTPEQQKEFLDRLQRGSSEETDEEAVEEEFKVD